jgi:hypothetical protein
VHEVADSVVRDTRVTQDVVGAAVVTDDAIEDAGMLGTVELEEERRRTASRPSYDRLTSG